MTKGWMRCARKNTNYNCFLQDKMLSGEQLFINKLRNFVLYTYIIQAASYVNVSHKLPKISMRVNV